MKKRVCVLLAAALLFTYLPASISAEEKEDFQAVQDNGFESQTDMLDYRQYMSRYQQEKPAGEKIILGVEEVLPQFKPDIQQVEGRQAVVAQEGKPVTWEFACNSPGLYQIVITYFPLEGNGVTIQRDLLLDGKVPYSEARGLSFERIWKDSAEKRWDTQGNEVRASQAESPAWRNKELYDSKGYYNDPLKFYIAEGTHTLTFNWIAEPMAIEKVELVPARPLQSYAEALKAWKENGAVEKSGTLNLQHIQAESTNSKSSQSLLPCNERGSASVEPYEVSKIVYNTIGKNRWKMQGQWLEWAIDVPEDGLYNIALKWRQNEKNNGSSSRELRINGEVPFEEAKYLTFDYSSKWRVTRLCDSNTKEPFLFYLTKGRHTLTLRVNLGRNAQIVENAQSLLQELNDIYLSIVMVTGPSPDINRDYDFEGLIPDTLKKMQRVLEGLQNLQKQINGKAGGGSASIAEIRRICTQIEAMLKDTETISKRLNNFQSNISSYGAWIASFQEQPLELDYLILVGTNESLPKAETGFLKSALHHFKQYIHSFLIDYKNIGNTEENNGESLVVWLGSDTAVTATSVGATGGRDQAGVIQQLTTDRFVSEKKIPVNIQLVNAGSLLPATLSGLGPDVALGLAQATPVNYALRNALYNLREFSDLDEVLTRFHDQAIVPFTLDGNVYAIPETQVFPMLFYRKDILAKLGISLSDLSTWERLLQVVLPRLQMNYLNFGMEPTMNNFAMFLYQYGGSFYNQNQTSATLDTPEGIAAFELFTSVYTEYKQNLSFSFINRFRTGQMPLGIQNYTIYNQLAVFAPEVDGLWGMLPVPGTLKEDGTISRCTAQTVTGCAILGSSKKKKEGWEFIKWWTDSETQAQYSRELEAIMGESARQPSANLKAIDKLPWSPEIKSNLLLQLQEVKAIPEIAGGYYTSRSFDFAFRKVVYDGKDIRETLSSAQEEIDNEIAEKQRELSRRRR